VKLIPAIDLKDNKCVRLIKGKQNSSKIFNENPIEQAIFFEKEGCERLHIVDLDGAFGRKDINKNTIIKIRESTTIPIELGGGIKDKNDILFWLNIGVDFIILGSLALKNTQLILNILNDFKNKIYVALDILNNTAMIKGWVEKSPISLSNIFEIYNNSHIRGYILTDVSRDGMLEGLDIDLINKLINKTKKKIIVGGGLSNYDDLYNLKNIKFANLEGVIVGKSFYSGNININKALRIISSNA
jgi:phosphoribosylformimino-5-aminoimidazole carboxamide ribotide isomerase